MSSKQSSAVLSMIVITLIGVVLLTTVYIKLQGNELHGKELHGKELHGKELHGKELHGKELHGKEIHGKEIQGKEAFYEDAPTQSPSIVSADGATLLDTRCRVNAAGNAPYVMTVFPGLLKHPTQSDTCYFRSLTGNGRIIATQECLEGSEIHDGSVIESIGNDMVLGVTRCVIKLKTGLPASAYEGYDKSLEDKAIERTDRFTALVSDINVKKGDMIADAADRDATTDLLNQAITSRQAQHRVLVADYGTLEDTLNSATTLANSLVSKVMTADMTLRKRDEMINLAAAKQNEAATKRAQLASAQNDSASLAASGSSQEQAIGAKNIQLKAAMASCTSPSGKTTSAYPPPMSGYTLTRNGQTFTVSASTERGREWLRAWEAFDGVITKDGYKKWQSTDACYDKQTRAAITSPPFDDGYNDASYPGEWVQLALSFPLFLTGYKLGGDMIAYRFYASNTSGSWDLMDFGTRAPSDYSDFSVINTFMFNNPITKAYTKFLIRIGSSQGLNGWERAGMSWFQVLGYPG